MPRKTAPRALLLLCCILATSSLTAVAQVRDAFTDNDFTHDPPWSGTTDRWIVEPIDGDPALRTNGIAGRDTLYLATSAAVGFGTWSFTFGFIGVNLSSFNGARVYLLADGEELTASIRGYYLQLGTNNSDEVRLYRQDGLDAGDRVLLGRSAPLLTGDSMRVRVQVERTPETGWTVRIDDVPVLYSDDATYTRGDYIGIWVKHTADARRAFYFDDVMVEALDVPVDRELPTVRDVTYDGSADLVRVRFSEPLDASTLRREAFEIWGAGQPAHVTLDEAHPDVAVLRYEPPLPEGRHALLITGVADLAGNPVAPGTMIEFDVVRETPAEPDVIIPPAPGDVVINEILFAPASGVPEFVELLNRSDEAVDLRALLLADDRLRPVALTQTRKLVPPGALVVLTSDSLAFAAAFPGIAALKPASWPALNDAGDTVTLLAGDVVIDAVPYVASSSRPGVSLERIDPAGPSGHPRNFAPSLSPAGATPGAVNTRYAPDLSPPVLRYAEQIDTQLVEITFSEPLDTASLSRESFLLDARTATSLDITSDTTVIVAFTGTVRGATVSAIGVRDLTGNRSASEALAVVARPEPGDLAFNEILFAPRADRYDGLPDQPEYVEIINTTAFPLSLRGCYWTHPPDESGNADTLRFAGLRQSIPPGGYAVVFAGPASGHSAALFEAFPDAVSADPPATLLPYNATSLRLPNNGDRLYLHRRDGLVIDVLAYEASWHDPSLTNTTGVSLERVDARASGIARTNWASSRDASGGTPGRPNSVRREPGAALPVPGAIVFSEILYQPAAHPSAVPEFVELFNTTQEALELNGLFMTRATNPDGSPDTLRLVNSPTALPAGGYLLVWSIPSTVPMSTPEALLSATFPGLAGVVPPPVPAPLRRSSLTLPNAGARLRLHRADGEVLDEVNYAPAWHHPNLRETAGISLEKIDPRTSSDDPANWSSSVDPAGATPGRPNSLHRASGENMVGVTVDPSPFSIERDRVTTVRYAFGREGALVRARVFDAAGRLVRTLTEAQLAAASGILQWDGLDDAGERLRMGIYIVFVEALFTNEGKAEAYRVPVVLARPFE